MWLGRRKRIYFELKQKMRHDSFMEMNAAHHAHLVWEWVEPKRSTLTRVTKSQRLKARSLAEKYLNRIQVVKPGDPGKLEIKIAI